METLNMQFQPFFDWLLRTTWQASLLICLILLIQIMLRGRLGIRWHYCLWLLLLVRMAMPWTPKSRVSLFNLIPQPVTQRQTEYAREQVESESVTPDVASVGTGESAPTPATGIVQESPELVTPVPQVSQESKSTFKSKLFELADILPLIWLIGASVLAVYVCVSNFNLLRIVKRQRPLTDQNILDLLEDCKSQMGIRTILGVVVTNKIKSPALFGFVRPRLLLPQGMIEALSHEELRYVFLHELAHLRRHDIYVGWLMSLLQVLHWFNPLVWLAFYRMRADRELACDALVLARTKSDEPKSYGRIIVSLLERFSRPQRLPSMAGILETKTQLKRRITMIAKFKKNSYQWSPLAVILIIILTCVSLPNAKRTKASIISSTKPEVISEAVSQLTANAPDRDIQKTSVVMKELDIQYSKGNLGGFDLSRDGSKLVYCRQEKEAINLVVRNLVSGEETQITDYVTGYACQPVFSPDGSEIIYTHAQKPGANPLHIVSLKTGEDRSTMEHNGAAWDWSRDGRFVLVRHGGGRYSILLVSGEGIEKTDMSLPARMRQHEDLRFSPDTKYLSFARDGNLYSFPINGGDEIQITKGSHGDVQPIWSSDGKMLVFLSRQRFGPELDLCGIPVVEGKASGDMQVILPDFGDNVRLNSISETGRLLYQRILKERYIFMVAIDPQTGQPTGEPVKLAAGTHPIWSPDGNRIAYLVKEQNLLRVMSPDGSVDQEIMEVQCAGTDTYAWASRDHIYIVDYLDARRGIYAISLLTKEKRPVLVDKSISHLTCSCDGKRLAFIKSPSSGRRRKQVFIIDVDGTNLRQLTFYKDGRVYYPTWSPDGKQIAFEYGAGGGIKALMVVSVEDGTIREIFRGSTPQDRFLRKTWSPDGSKIAWSTWSGIRIGQLSDGKSDKFKIDIDEAYGPIWSSDGSKMLFGTWVDDEQLMIMDNFLPQTDEAK